MAYAVGDVHGRADLLAQLLEAIEGDAREARMRVMIVFVGDYVDRGPHSREVLEMLCADPAPYAECRFLKGNHEAQLLAFLDDARAGPEWAAFGGGETLFSYGVTPPKSITDLGAWRTARSRLVAALPARHRAFLEGLELHVVLGGYMFVHAGLRPGRPLSRQATDDLLCIREPFLSSRHAFEHVVVHGHTPARSPHSDDRRIGVDTGAYATNVLTAVRLEGASRRFLSAQSGAPASVASRRQPR